jgi:hypothetical protein
MTIALAPIRTAHHAHPDLRAVAPAVLAAVLGVALAVVPTAASIALDVDLLPGSYPSLS